MNTWRADPALGCGLMIAGVAVLVALVVGFLVLGPLLAGALRG